MTDVEYGELRKAHLERLSKDNFGVDLHVNEIIANDVTTGKGSYTTVFRADRHTIYALCETDDNLTLADVKQIVRSMGMEAETYLPPHADSDYFKRIGQKAFSAVFPGRKEADPQESIFYQNMALYNPALVKIAKVNGEIRRFNSVMGRWQRDLNFSYMRMQVR